jgi:hypothetical protein
VDEIADTRSPDRLNILNPNGACISLLRRYARRVAIPRTLLIVGGIVRCLMIGLRRRWAFPGKKADSRRLRSPLRKESCAAWPVRDVAEGSPALSNP